MKNKEIRKYTFKYWFAHWCSFQVIAFQLDAWHPRFLFHDFLKPWLNLFMTNAEVKRFHHKTSKHHLDNNKPHDHLAMIIDWECQYLSKENHNQNSSEYIISYIKSGRKLSDYDRHMIFNYLRCLKLISLETYKKYY